MSQPLFKQLEITVKQANRRAMNRAGRKALREVQNLVMSRFNMRLSDLNNKTRLRTSIKDDDTFRIIMPALPVSASLFRPVQTYSSGERKKFVTGAGNKKKLKESGVQKRNRDFVDRTTIEYIRGRREEVKQPGGMKPFIAKMKSGHLGVFYRIGKKRLGIKEYGMGSVAGLISSRIAMDELTAKFQENYVKELDRLLKESGN
ncbi:MAG: hypothetical protein LCH52_05530 [Bacteroidetes bacterium]|nr:hypothetical protein [Bacteroidota bacterium]